MESTHRRPDYLFCGGGGWILLVLHHRGILHGSSLCEHATSILLECLSFAAFSHLSSHYSGQQPPLPGRSIPACPCCVLLRASSATARYLHCQPTTTSTTKQAPASDRSHAHDSTTNTLYSYHSLPMGVTTVTSIRVHLVSRARRATSAPW